MLPDFPNVFSPSGFGSWTGSSASATDSVLTVILEKARVGEVQRIEYVGTFDTSDPYRAGTITEIREYRTTQLVSQMSGLEVDAGRYFQAVWEYKDAALADQILTTQGPDVPPGEPPSDPTIVQGTDGNDLLIGTAENDFFTPRGGQDRIEGGTGADTVILDMMPTSISFYPDYINSDVYNGPSQFLFDVEILRYPTASGTNEIRLVDHVGLASLTAEELESFIELYIAYFNRAPDALGLTFWGSAYANGLSLEEIAALFIDQPETRAAYSPNTSNLAFAETVYQNVLGRVPDAAGLGFWEGQLNSGVVSRDQFILEVLRGAKSDFQQDRGLDFVNQQLADRSFLANKVQLGEFFALGKGISNTQDATEMMALFDGSEVGYEAAGDAGLRSLIEVSGREVLLKVEGLRAPVVPEVFIESPVLTVLPDWIQTSTLSEGLYYFRHENPDRLNDIYYTGYDGIEFDVLASDGSFYSISLSNGLAITAPYHEAFVGGLQTPLQEMIEAGGLPPDTRLFVDASRTTTITLDDGSAAVLPAIVLSSASATFFPTGFHQDPDYFVSDVFTRFESELTPVSGPLPVPTNNPPIGFALGGEPGFQNRVWIESRLIYDADGIDRNTEQVQWFRDGVPIAGAVEERYLIGEDDRGTTITVQYSYTDGAGKFELLVDSVFVPDVDPALQSASRMSNPDTLGEPQLTDTTDINIIGGAAGGEDAMVYPLL